MATLVAPFLVAQLTELSSLLLLLFWGVRSDWRRRMSFSSEIPSSRSVPEEEEDPPELDIVINNVVCSFSVRCHLNLEEIATRGINVEYRKENGVRLIHRIHGGIERSAILLRIFISMTVLMDRASTRLPFYIVLLMHFRWWRWNFVDPIRRPRCGLPAKWLARGPKAKKNRALPPEDMPDFYRNWDLISDFGIFASSMCWALAHYHSILKLPPSLKNIKIEPGKSEWMHRNTSSRGLFWPGVWIS